MSDRSHAYTLFAALAVLFAGNVAAQVDDDTIFKDGFDPPAPALCGWNTAPGTPGALSGSDPGAVSALKVWNDDVYVGGSAGDSFNGIAGGLSKMDPLTYATTSLGDASLSDGFVNAFVPFDAGDGEKLYVLGAFNGISTGGGTLPGSRVIMSWDGSTVATVPSAPIESLDFLWTGQILGGKLAIAGSRNASDPPQKPLLMLWDGITWQTWSDEFSGTVAPVILTSAVFQDKLYIGGRFSSVQLPGTDPVASINLMAFDGTTFSTVGGGLKRGSGVSQVLSMAVFDDGTGEALYVGGRFDRSADGTPLLSVAKWDGNAFSAVGAGFPSPNDVRGLAVYDDGTGAALYATGTFTADAGGSVIRRFAKWDGTSWSQVGGGIGVNPVGTDPPVNPGPMVALPGAGLVVGGSFIDVGDEGVTGFGPAGGLAYWYGDCP